MEAGSCFIQDPLQVYYGGGEFDIMKDPVTPDGIFLYHP